MSPRLALAGIPEWSDVTIEERLGGLTNRTYKIRRGGEAFVLRLDDGHTWAFGLDRERELRILDAASKKALAPEVVFADIRRGILIRRFVDGRVWTEQDLHDPLTIESIGAVLRRVHRLPLSGDVFDAGEIAARYLGRLEGHDELTAIGRRCVRVIDESDQADAPVTCHNDVVAANIVSAKTLMLLDWEYACDNDPLFDLASLIGFHDMDRGAAELLLGAYAGGATPEARERLGRQTRTYDALQWLWFAVRETISPNAQQRRRLAAIKRRLL